MIRSLSFAVAPVLSTSPVLAHTGAHFHASDVPWLASLLCVALVALGLWVWKIQK